MVILVIGGGEMGAALAGQLAGGGHRVVVIEKDPVEADLIRATQRVAQVFEGSGTDPAMLEQAGIRQADVVAAVTGTDETNLVAANLARFAFDVPRVVARVNRPVNAWLFNQSMGVDVAVNQAELFGHLTAEQITIGDLKTLFRLRKGDFLLVEEKVEPDSLADGRAVGELGLPEQCVLAAVIRGGKLIIPHGETMLEEGDEILAVIHASELDVLTGLMSGPLL